MIRMLQKKDQGQWDCIVVDDSVSFGNGVALSADQQHLYVMASEDYSMIVYNRSSPTSPSKDATSLVAKKWKEIKTPSMCDNLYVDDKSGEVFAGCHSNPWKLRKRMFFSGGKKENGSAAPSQVLRWDGNENWQEVFRCNGDAPCIEGSSTGVFCKDTNVLLVGSVFDNGILQCELKL